MEAEGGLLDLMAQTFKDRRPAQDLGWNEAEEFSHHALCSKRQSLSRSVDLCASVTRKQRAIFGGFPCLRLPAQNRERPEMLGMTDEAKKRIKGNGGGGARLGASRPSGGRLGVDPRYGVSPSHHA